MQRVGIDQVQRFGKIAYGQARERGTAGSATDGCHPFFVHLDAYGAFRKLPRDLGKKPARKQHFAGFLNLGFHTGENRKGSVGAGQGERFFFRGEFYAFQYLCGGAGAERPGRVYQPRD